MVGVDPADGEEITAQNGRYGPYLKKGTDSRSLESEEQIFDITLERGAGDLRPAQAARAAGRGRRRCASSAPTRCPGKPMVVKDGRFGPYVTDGETNATLRKGDDVETITVERAAELLAEKRAKGPAPKKRAAKKAPAKKAAGKKAAGEEGGREEGRGQALTAGPDGPRR